MNNHAHWLTASATDDSDSIILQECEQSNRQEYPFPPEIGQGWYEKIQLADKISVCRGEYRFRPEATGQLVQQAEFKIELPETCLITQTVHGGTLYHREFYPAANLIYKPGHDFFRHADRLHVIPFIDTSSDSDMTCLTLADSALTEMVGADMAEQLLDKLGLNPSPVVKVLPIPLHVTASLRACLSPALTGSLRKLFAQAKVLEYLCALTTHICVRSIVKPQVNRKRDAIQDLRNHLMQLEGKLPTLDQLAVNYGICAKWMNEAFEQEYGESIYNFITDHRLNESHAALLEGDVPIKIISIRLGYSHVSNFTVAFKKKFGYPPGSLRRDSRAED